MYACSTRQARPTCIDIVEHNAVIGAGLVRQHGRHIWDEGGAAAAGVRANGSECKAALLASLQAGLNLLRRRRVRQQRCAHGHELQAHTRQQSKSCGATAAQTHARWWPCMHPPTIRPLHAHHAAWRAVGAGSHKHGGRESRELKTAEESRWQRVGRAGRRRRQHRDDDDGGGAQCQCSRRPAGCAAGLHGEDKATRLGATGGRLSEHGHGSRRYCGAAPHAAAAAAAEPQLPAGAVFCRCFAVYCRLRLTWR